MEIFTWVMVFAASIWVLFNWVAPLEVLTRAERISPGRLPRELFTSKEARQVKFYLTDLKLGHGYSVWAPPLNFVVFDRKCFQKASPAAVRFLVAHELSHFHFGHHRKRWLMIVLGIGFTPFGKKIFERFEKEADDEAARRTGFPRSILSYEKIA